MVLSTRFDITIHERLGKDPPSPIAQLLTSAAVAVYTFEFCCFRSPETTTS
jgi:hypothetical protein